MGLSICSFASGSSGNCIFVSSGRTKILVDIGISVKRVEESLKQLGEGTENLSVLVTHAHFDHIKYVPAFVEKYGLPVYAHRKTMPSLRGKQKAHDSKNNFCDFFVEKSGGASGLGNISKPKNSLINEFSQSNDPALSIANGENKLIPFGEGDFFVGDITVSPFSVSHDVHCVGYSFYHQGKKLTVATDLGRLDDELIDRIKDSDAVLLESNHDLELINANPNYSLWLKRRILSDKGHLSNADCAAALPKLASCRTKNIILAHLSEENNYPELAFSEACSILSKSGIKEGRDVLIDVATANRMTNLIKID